MFGPKLKLLHYLALRPLLGERPRPFEVDVAAFVATDDVSGLCALKNSIGVKVPVLPPA